jgi:Zn-finger nucleic acid-binding protein
MNCPSCTEQLIHIEIGPVIADVCENGCGGSWLDRLELAKICASNASISHRVLPIKNKTNLPPKEHKQCPRDQKSLMHRSYIEKQTVVDECPQCGGIWIDHLDEFLQIASDFIQRNNLDAKQTRDYFSDEFKRD